MSKHEPKYKIGDIVILKKSNKIRRIIGVEVMEYSGISYLFNEFWTGRLGEDKIKEKIVGSSLESNPK